MLVMVLMHLLWGGWGWFQLLRLLGVRSRLAFVGTIAAACSGYVTLMSIIWIFVPIVYAWLPWILQGLMRASLPRLRTIGIYWLPVGLAAIAAIGNPQLLLYVYVWLAGFLLILAPEFQNDRRGLGLTLWLIVLGLAFSMPTLLPVYETFKYSVCSGGLPLSEFFSRGIRWETLCGLFFPSFDLPNAFLHYFGSLTLFQGTWFLPVVASCLVFMNKSYEPSSSEEQMGSPPIPLGRLICGTACLYLVFLLFSLGSAGYLYNLTRGIPIWGSMRWPFRFIVLVNASGALGGGLCLEQLARKSRGQGRRLLLVINGAMVVALLILKKPMLPIATSPVVISIAAGLCSVLCCHG